MSSFTYDYNNANKVKTKTITKKFDKDGNLIEEIVTEEFEETPGYQYKPYPSYPQPYIGDYPIITHSVNIKD